MSLALQKGLGMGSLNFSIYVKLYQKHKNSCTDSNRESISTFCHFHQCTLGVWRDRSRML